jgi:formate hydrogenlyase subunit 3/multisubunit Na+/H+ antiporter MnhD subunit
MDNLLYLPILLPLVFGAAILFFPRKMRYVRETLTILASLTMIGLTVYLFTQPDLTYHASWLTFRPGLSISFDLATSGFARMALLVVSCFSLMTSLYSFRFMEAHPRRVEYYAYYLAALGATFGAALADNLVVFLLFWELHGFLLFLMAGINGDEAIRSAAKTLVMAGIGDVTLMTGIGLLWIGTGNLSFSQLAAQPQLLTSGLNISAFVMILIGASVKGGIMPFHSWIPSISTHTPMTVMSYFTSLDKVLGIYLLTRISLSLFILDNTASLILMSLGALTLLGGVIMAMVQHDYRRMLAFHSVSQVGYMVLGIGTGTPIGILGGLFHLVNMIILKGSLYLCGGSVQRQTGRTDFEEMGGLAKAMPWTFAGTLVAALGIAGVPPLNAFVSKWLIYQGVIERGGGAFPLLLALAMFGSALTLASFIKLLYSMFWGVRAKGLEEVKEAPRSMTIPLIVLAAFAIGFGIFYRWPVETLLAPIVGSTPIAISGLWDAGLATTLMIASLLLGLVIWLLYRPREAVAGEVFIGGEKVDAETFRVRGTEFYGPVKEFTFLQTILSPAGQRALDIYNIGTNFLRWFSNLAYQYIDQSLAEFYEQIIPAIVTLVGKLLRLLNARLILTHALWIVYAGSAIALALAPGNESVATTVRIIAIVGMLGWAFLAWVETDLTRLVVLAATSQVGLILLGGSMSLGLALSYLASSGIALLFLAGDTWLIRRQWKTTDIEKMDGLASRSPWLFFVFIFSALWLSGLPPFGNFFSKYLLGVAADEISPFLGVAITATAIMTLAYMLKPISRFLRTT